MSLYRTYRPRAFADVVGQDPVVTTLETAVEKGKLAHAYLFAGSRGTGKTSVARILAKAMLTQGVTDEALGRQIIAAVDDGSLVDLVEIDGASNRGIDDIRSLVEKIQFSPVAASAKVYIIDEVHMLTKEAFNALLKTLEEPPPYAYFILATTELQKIPATIQSRCQRFAFRQVPEEDIIRRLQFIADQEHITVDRTALRAIAHRAEGGVRDAIALLDQLRSLPKIGLEDVHERIGDSGHEYVEQIFAAVEARNRQELLALVRKMESAGIALENVTRMLLSEARRQLHAAVDAGESIASIERLLAGFLGTLRDMRVAPVPGLVLEAALLSFCSDEDSEPEAKSRFFGKKKVPEGKPASASKAPPADTAAMPSPESEPQPKPQPSADALVEVPELTVAALRDVWPSILKEVSPPSLKMSLKNGHIQEVRESTVMLAFSSAFHRDKAAKTESARLIEQLLEKAFRKSLRLECVLEEEHRAPLEADKDMVNVAEAAAEVF